MLTENRSGSDFYGGCDQARWGSSTAPNPGSRFRGLHESVINYGGNENPEFITCCHEGIGRGHGLHGYSKNREEQAPWRFFYTATWDCGMDRWPATTPCATACRCT